MQLSLWVRQQCMLLLKKLGLYTYDICAGFMLGNLPKEKAGLISKEHICEGMSTYTAIHAVNLTSF